MGREGRNKPSHTDTWGAATGRIEARYYVLQYHDTSPVSSHSSQKLNAWVATMCPGRHPCWHPVQDPESEPCAVDDSGEPAGCMSFVGTDGTRKLGFLGCPRSRKSTTDREPAPSPRFPNQLCHHLWGLGRVFPTGYPHNLLTDVYLGGLVSDLRIPRQGCLCGGSRIT